MKRTKLYWAISGLMITALISVGLVMAGKPTFQGAKVTNPVTGDEKKTVTIPPTAIEVAPNVFYLGEAVDKGKVVQGYAFIDYKKGYGKPPWAGGPGGGTDTSTSNCYSFLAKGAKWRVTEPYIVDPTNEEGLSDTFVKSNLATNIGKWETAAGADILGDEVSGTVDGADTENPDDKNEVYFGDVGSQGAIAVTIIWGIFRGPPSQRELVEWDQVYNDVDFDWSSSGEADKMDFENIATHELGHSVGLDDLYEDKCSEQTMYGYASYGETKKRTLEDGDIAGVKELYAA